MAEKPSPSEGSARSKLTYFVRSEAGQSYVTLSTACPEIRILRLIPSTDRESIVRGQLVHANLDHTPVYDALSYTWGTADPALAQSIEIDDHRNFSVTQNAARALKDMRATTDSLLIWIDAICINQGDIPERNAQVRLMGRIYSQARSVRIWLDCNIDPNSFSFQRLLNLRRDGADNDMENVDEVHDLFERMNSLPYWRRVWIQQEVRLAQDRRIFFRHTEMQTGNLVLWMTQAEIILKSFNVQPFYSSFTTILGLSTSESLTHHTRQTRFVNLLKALTHARLLEATDPRDRIYALLALVDDPQIGEIIVDYGLAVREVFTAVAGYIIKRYHSLDFLHQASCSYFSLVPGLASWVPRWTERSPSVQAHSLFEYRTHVSPLPYISPCGDNLHVYGSRLGRVHSTLIPPTLQDDAMPWCPVYKMLEGIGFGMQQAFATFEALCAGAFTETFHKWRCTERPATSPMLQLARSIIDEGVHEVEELTRYAATETIVDFVTLQNEFRRETAESICLVTDEGDFGLTVGHLYLSADRYEIWAIQRCHTFVVLNPLEGAYEVVGAASICGPYTKDSQAWDSYGANGPDLFKVLADRGRQLEIRELMLR